MSDSKPEFGQQYVSENQTKEKTDEQQDRDAGADRARAQRTLFDSGDPVGPIRAGRCHYRPNLQRVTRWSGV